MAHRLGIQRGYHSVLILKEISLVVSVYAQRTNDNTKNLARTDHRHGNKYLFLGRPQVFIEGLALELDLYPLLQSSFLID